MKAKIFIKHLSSEYYDLIPDVYSSSFKDHPWPKDWYDIPQFNPDSNWISIVDEKVVGYLISFISSGRPYISVLATRDEYQNMGVGSLLISEALNYWRRKNYSTVFIHVDKNRSNALSLYRKLGFEKMGVKDGAIELECKL